MNRRIFASSFSPGAASMPDDTSTAYGRAARTASPTFSALSPPASTNGRLTRIAFQSKDLLVVAAVHGQNNEVRSQRGRASRLGRTNSTRPVRLA